MRGNASIQKINDEIASIVDVVGSVIDETAASGNGGEALQRLSSCRDRLLEAGDRGNDLAARGIGGDDRDWRMWTQTLPPIAFELVRETKELVHQLDPHELDDEEDDFR